MKVLDKYILREFWKKIILFSVVITSLLLVEDVYKNLSAFLTNHAKISDVLSYYIHHSISLIPLILPLSLLITLLIEVTYMFQNNEITALRATGVSLFKITKVFWILGCCCSGLLLLLNLSLIPKSLEKSFLILENSLLAKRDKGSSNDQKHLSFLEKNRLWYINFFNEKTAECRGISIHEYDENGDEWHRILGKEGFLTLRGWWIKKGQEIFFDTKTHVATSSKGIKEKTFPNLSEDPRLMSILRYKPKNLSYFQLKRILALGSNHKNHSAFLAYKMRFLDIFCSPINCILTVLLVISMVMAGPRMNPMIGISKSIFAVGIYVFMFNLAHALGESGAINYLIAAFLPATILILAALFRMKKFL